VSLSRPPFDPELAVTLEAIRDRLPPTVTPQMIQPMRDAPPPVTVEELLAGRPITRADHTIPGFRDGEIQVTVFARDGHTEAGPAIVRFHGGGMVMGSRFSGIVQPLTWVERFDAVCVAVDYRLAPQHPDPYPVQDCYATLLWTVEHAAELGVDPARIVVNGPSAGGGLAAGVALLARDRGGPPLLGQLLVSPMLDDRNETVSSHQIDGVGVWDRGSNDTGWNALLGERRGTEAVSIYAAPSRATELTGLPPAYLECGSAEVFRDEDVAYASSLWAAGVQAELHVWPGAFHASDQLAPDAALSREAVAARDAWMARLLGR
jgi:acetyl esterase/lipase